MLYHHISGKKRRQIEELVQAGNSNKTIAARLWRSQSTIGREIRRNTAYGGRGYFSKRAQELALARRQNSKVPKISEKTWAKVFELYNLDLSPEQIASQVKISHESIYRRIYAEIKAGKLDRKHLRYADRNAMSFSIENRVPFLTAYIANFAHNLPSQLLISDNGVTKFVLRECVKDLLPKEIFCRKDKLGFPSTEGL